MFTFDLDILGTEKENIHESCGSSQLLCLDAINMEINSTKMQQKKKIAQSFPSLGSNFDDIDRP